MSGEKKTYIVLIKAESSTKEYKVEAIYMSIDAHWVTFKNDPSEMSHAVFPANRVIAITTTTTEETSHADH